MDFDSSSKFISSLAKFLQSLCNGYVEFNNGVEVIGHIYLNVDTGKKIDYILNEKVCKTDENSVTFISNSFHAQPAEKPKPPGRNVLSSDSTKSAEPSGKAEEEDIIIMEEPESKNVGTLPPRDSFQQQGAGSHAKSGRPSKRSYNQSFPSSQRHSSKLGRSDHLSIGPNGAPPDTDSLHLESNSAEFVPPHLPSDSTLTTASESDMSHLSKVFPQTFDNSTNNAASEERDIKPRLDSDMNIVEVKQEFDPSDQGGEDDQENYDESQDQSVFPGMGYDQYYGDGARRGKRSDYGQIGNMSQGEYFQGGAGPSEAMPGDSSVPSLRNFTGNRWFPSMSPLTGGPFRPSLPPDLAQLPLPTLQQLQQQQQQHDSFGKMRRKMNFECELCGKRLPSRREYIGHMNGRHLGQKPFSCEYCGRQFAYMTSLPMHKKTCTVAQRAKLNPSEAAQRPSLSGPFPSSLTDTTESSNLQNVSALPTADIPSLSSGLQRTASFSQSSVSSDEKSPSTEDKPDYSSDTLAQEET